MTAGVARFKPLVLTLLVVYAAMALLSAVDMQDQPLRPGQWRLGVPRFILQESDTGWIHIDGQAYGFNSFNQRKILEQAAINLTLGVGMTFVILTGGIDLSVGSLLALCNVVFVRTILAWGADGAPGAGLLIVGVIACVAVGVLCGIGNGWLSVSLGIPSFIVTLGTMFVARGLAFWASGGQTYYMQCPGSLSIGIPIGVSVLAVVAAGVFLSTTVAGRNVYAVGGNLLACEYSGMRTRRVRIMCFAFSGLCAGLAGMIYWSRVSAGSYLAGETAELYAIAAVVLGGTRLAGGEGSIVGTMIGALIMAVLANGLNAASVDQTTQKIVVGCVLIVAAYIDSRRGRSGAAGRKRGFPVLSLRGST